MPIPESYAARLLALGLLVLPVGGMAADEEAEKQKGEEVDYVSLGARLLKDGHLGRAESALKKADPAAEEVDAARLYTLWGLVDLKRGENASARDHLRRAIDAGQTGKTVYLYLAQAHYRLQEYRPTIDAIERAGLGEQDNPNLYAILARSHWELENGAEAWAALDAGQKRYPEHTAFLRQKIFYLIELELYQKAARLGEEYLAGARATVADYLAIGRAMRRSGQLEQARDFLEAARLQYPGDPRLGMELAQVYLKLDQTLTAAQIYEQAAFRDPELLTEAAELYRRSGKLYRALNLNAQVADSGKKLKQRLAILLETERYAMAAAMRDDLLRAGLLENEDIRYALAYARFKNGEFEKAEAQLSRLTRSDLFRKATKLRKAMADCRDAAWKCY
ncbi:tetratricopeptide repeat protein [Thiohalorhabdus sp. Cl-TMA]|uniref:Tetratricopeptide repeat protein n=1 Tax=Thiohalorhabdus methylotrophus TaxID=3242694 RepID=A0ABV4TRQ5_9GAMM